jgi:hypothetical protein
VPLEETEQQEWRARMRNVMVSTRFIKSLGVTAVTWEPDEVVLRVDFDDRLTNDGKEYHGGSTASSRNPKANRRGFAAHSAAESRQYAQEVGASSGGSGSE